MPRSFVTSFSGKLAAQHCTARHPDPARPVFSGHRCKINPFSPEEPGRSVAKRIQRLREIGQTIGQICRWRSHPPEQHPRRRYVRELLRAGKDQMYDLAKEGLVLAHQQMDFMIAVLRNYQKRDWVDVGGMKVALPKDLGFHDQGYLEPIRSTAAQALTNAPPGTSTGLRKSGPLDWYMGEMEISLEEPKYPVGGTTKLAPRSTRRWKPAPVSDDDGQPVEVGPRARLVKYRNFDEKGTIGQNVAREMEYTDSLYEMIDCIDELNPSGKVVADYIPNGDGSLGWAANEAPRGTDVHIAKVKD